MRLHTFARGLLAGGISVVALLGGAGVARAEPEPAPPPVPPIIQIITSTPALSLNPTNQGGPSSGWNGSGMYCQNMFVKCSTGPGS
jgi:hypothetical protein